jgi:type II secretory pathway component GspD/PulD (secretin)
MLKRVATLWLAMVLTVGMAAHAAERPGSMDRHMAPDEYPTNVVKILRTTNKAQTNSYVPVVFDFKNNNPFAVIRQLRRPMQQEEGLVFTFVNPNGASGKVLFMTPKYQIEYLKALIADLDKAGITTSDGSTTMYRQLKHRRVDDSDSDFVDTAFSFTGPGGTFLDDPETNALFLYDAKSSVDALEGALDNWLDVPTAMVQAVVKVYELDSYNDGALGLDYQNWRNTVGQDLFSGQVYSDYGSLERVEVATFDPLGNIAASGPGRDMFQTSGRNYAYKYDVSSEFFDFLETKGKARILNQIKLAALNTRPALISAGDQVLYYSISASQSAQGPTLAGESSSPVSNASRTVTESLEAIETGLRLKFTPTISEQTVVFDCLQIDWSDYVAFDSDGFPMINSREIDLGSVRVALGDEIVIGGLKRRVRLNSTEKVPFFGSLPILGYLFGGEKTQNRDSEVVVALQPVGIMDYAMAGKTLNGKHEQLVIDQATDKKPVEGPETTFGFDMFGMDSAIDLTVKTP